MAGALARIAAVTPQRGRRVGKRMDLVMERLEKVGARSKSGEPDEAPEKVKGEFCCASEW